MRILFTLMVWAAASICAAAEEVVTIPTRTGVTLAYLLVRDPSASPRMVVISFVGGEGAVNLVKRSADHPPSFGPAANLYNVERLSRSFALISVSGGDPPHSGPCDSQSPHGYFGRDAAVVQAIKHWMLGRDFAREIG